jgi:hypothetical protein
VRPSRAPQPAAVAALAGGEDRGAGGECEPAGRGDQLGSDRETLDAQPDLVEVGARTARVPGHRADRVEDRARVDAPGSGGKRAKKARSRTGSCAPRRTTCRPTASGTGPPGSSITDQPFRPHHDRTKEMPRPVQPGQIAPIRRA